MNSRVRSLGITIAPLRFSRPRRRVRAGVVFNLKYGDTPWTGTELKETGKEFRGKVKEKWGKLTDDDLTAINGKRDQLEGRLQQRYGFAKDQVRKDIDSWFSALK